MTPDLDTPTYTDEYGVMYRWDTGHIQHTLYGLPVLSHTRIPNGRIMTIKNTAGQSLVIHGEMHEGKIRFIHLCGEGGDLSLGAWVPLAVQPAEARFPVEFLKHLGWTGEMA